MTTKNPKDTRGELARLHAIEKEARRLVGAFGSIPPDPHYDDLRTPDPMALGEAIEELNGLLSPSWTGSQALRVSLEGNDI